MAASVLCKHMANVSRTRALRLVIVALALGLLVPLWFNQITGARIESDPAAYVQMSANLIRHGVISLDAQQPLRPSMYREPLPILTAALAMSITDRLHGQAAVSDYLQGERARFLKLQNVFWLFLLCISAAWAVYLLTASYGAAMAAALLAHLPFYGHWVGGTLDSLYTEQAAAGVLMAASAALVAAVTRPLQLAYAALAGAAFGALALIKASFLYVFAGLVCALLAVQLFQAVRQRLGIRFAGLALLIFSFAAVLSPWLYRNWREFGTLEITDRAGAILILRAVKNDMTPLEYRGAFYVWAPKPLRPLVGSLLGFGPKDLMRGGRLQRLNRSDSDFHADDVAAQRAGRPEDAVSFYYKTRAERNQLRRQFQAAGHPQPELAADEVLQTQALDRIRHHPWRHLAATPPFLWRGAFLPFPLLLCALCYGFWRSRYDLVLFAAPAFGSVMFYGLLTHFILRYGVPAWPVALASATVLGVIGLQAALNKSSREPANDSLPRPAVQ
ncbi:MAG TPA: hypothetical protein VHK24_04205 [Steroidobacter sp.]|nr:hypothetical protein [Steroidobacter sp.]